MSVPSFPVLRALFECGVVSPLDWHFATAAARLAGESREVVVLAAALASRQVLHGHVCLDLRLATGGPLTDESGEPVAGFVWPALAPWCDALRSSALVESPARGSCLAPLLLDDAGRLYLRRYWTYQCRIAEAIRARAAEAAPELDGETLAEGLTRLFPSDPDAPPEPDWQKLAAFAAVSRRFCVISGGPGTGKTHTVVKILALLVEQAVRARRRPPRLMLLAPTGKAAARLKEAVARAKRDLPCAPEVVAAIPEQASTIHRALGAEPGSATRFRHDADAPLVADVVLVDEASMIDLALMAHLVVALPAHARLILLGDQDQLASVEAGAVLGDICNAGGDRAYSRAFIERAAAGAGVRLPVAPGAPAQTGIWDCIVQLTRSYRYGPRSGVAQLARAVNAGDAGGARDLLAAGADDVSSAMLGRDGEIDGPLAAAVSKGFAPSLKAARPETRLRALEGFRVLCAHRAGPFGVASLNHQIERLFADAGWIARGETNYIGRPVLVTRNDYQLELFNGDVGVIVADPAPERRHGSAVLAYFEGSDGRPRYLSPSRLPPHETVFAMTIHKSQGSEFDEVAIVLPDHASPVLSRELLYTAISRARRRVTLYGTPAVIEHAVTHRIERASGLRDALWERRQ
jgi:exodeoxyribonuclease V alpha subunit